MIGFHLFPLRASLRLALARCGGGGLGEGASCTDRDDRGVSSGTRTRPADESAVPFGMPYADPSIMQFRAAGSGRKVTPGRGRGCAAREGLRQE